VEVEGGTLTSLAGFDGHQGVALVVEPRRWATIDEVLARAKERGEPPFVLVLDSLEDPQNMGTMLRSAEACGVHGVLFPTRRAAPLTASAIKASAGAVEHLLLVPLEDLAGGLVDLRLRGLRMVGADESASLSYREADLRGPLALVVGSEGHGISGSIRRRIDLAVRIPMRGRVGSLNAAVAGSVLLFEAAAQRPAPEVDPGVASDGVADVDAAPAGESVSAAEAGAIGAEEAIVAAAQKAARKRRTAAPADPAPTVHHEGAEEDIADDLLPG
jgi:23S rRNA (guanosine2251-2'-O)-methyltransferase